MLNTGMEKWKQKVFYRSLCITLSVQLISNRYVFHMLVAVNSPQLYRILVVFCTKYIFGLWWFFPIHVPWMGETNPIKWNRQLCKFVRNNTLHNLENRVRVIEYIPHLTLREFCDKTYITVVQKRSKSRPTQEIIPSFYLSPLLRSTTSTPWTSSSFCHRVEQK